MRQLLRLLAFILAARALHRVLFGGIPGADIPPLLDEAEAFERRVRAVLPPTWALDQRAWRPSEPVGPAASRPYLGERERAWVLSTPWPGHEPQRAQVVLYLLREGAPVGARQETLAQWERFTVVAQDPNVMSVGGETFSWSTLPGWPTARADLRAALGR